MAADFPRAGCSYLFSIIGEERALFGKVLSVRERWGSEGLPAVLEIKDRNARDDAPPLHIPWHAIASYREWDE